MKKRYIAAAGLAALTGLYAFGSHIQATCVPGNADYEAGTGVCTSKNRKADAKGGWNARQREAKKDTFQVNRTSVAMLALNCETKHIRPFLKDPNSFRELNHTYKETVDRIYVQVNYTATNGFGGRVQGSKVCNYTL